MIIDRFSLSKILCALDYEVFAGIGGLLWMVAVGGAAAAGWCEIVGGGGASPPQGAEAW